MNTGIGARKRIAKTRTTGERTRYEDTYTAVDIRVARGQYRMEFKNVKIFEPKRRYSSE